MNVTRLYKPRCLRSCNRTNGRHPDRPLQYFSISCMYGDRVHTICKVLMTHVSHTEAPGQAVNTQTA